MNDEAIHLLQQRGFKVTQKSKMPQYSYPQRNGEIKSAGGECDCTLKQPKVYTGTAIIGIATMHKSNAVPVFSQEDAIAISNMRR